MITIVSYNEVNDVNHVHPEISLYKEEDYDRHSQIAAKLLSLLYTDKKTVITPSVVTEAIERGCICYCPDLLKPLIGEYCDFYSENWFKIKDEWL